MPEGLCWWGNPHSLLVGLQSDEASIKTSIDNSQNRLKSYRDNCSAVFISGKKIYVSQLTNKKWKYGIYTLQNTIQL